MWLEQLACAAPATEAYPFPYVEDELDFRPLLQSIVRERMRGRSEAEIARAFQHGLAHGLLEVVVNVCESYGPGAVVFSGGVFQNELLLKEVKSLLEAGGFEVWTNHMVPPNDGGISLGQAAMAAFARLE
jgi:hydrogenase maturation protein HypF